MCVNRFYENVLKPLPGINGKPIKKLSMCFPVAMLSLGITLTNPVLAADWSIYNVETTQQTLTTNDTGIISTAGQLTTGSSIAIIAGGDNAEVVLSGLISTTGSSAFAIYSTGSDFTFTSSILGNISTIGFSSSSAILAAGDGASLFNHGTISTSGSGSAAFNARGEDANLINYSDGSISTTGNYSNGIYDNYGKNATILNAGSISTAGNLSNGIESYGLFADITNSGSILSSGSDASGILLKEGYYTVSNSGSISVTGANSAGIRAFSVGTLNISGSISATGSATEAIVGNTQSQTVTLDGAQIIGNINLGQGSDLLTLQGNTTVNGNISFGNGSVGTLTFDQASNSVYSGIISGGMNFVKTNSGSLVLSGTNTYVGDTAINGGALSISAETNLGATTGALMFDGGSLITTASFVSNRATTLNAGGGTFSPNGGTFLTPISPCPGLNINTTAGQYSRPTGSY